MPRVALLQLTSGPDPATNLGALRALLEDLGGPTPAMIFTPENALVLGPPEEYTRVAEPLGDGPVQAEVAALARSVGTWLAVGSFPIRDPQGAVRATSLVYDGDGQLRAHYEKLHLFDVEVEGDRDGKAFAYRESDAFQPGDREVVLDSPAGALGLTICYDLRFPPLFANLRRRGAEVLAVPAAFTRVTGEAHWQTLLRARAIETQCYVLAPAQTGTHPDGRQTWGHTLAIDPWGAVLGVLEEGPGVLQVDLDLERLAGVRARMPVADHARYRSQLGG